MPTFSKDSTIKFFKTVAGKWTAAGLILTFIFGYFVGREHMKAELRSSLAEAFGGLGDALNGDEEPAPAKRKPALKNDPIGMTMTKKELLPSDYTANRYSDRLEFAFDFQNKTEKDIRAFVGTVTFYDLFDRQIHAITLTNEDGLTAGEVKTWEGGFDFNQFMDSHNRLATIEDSDLKAEFVTEQIIYADGTKEDL